MTLIIVIHRCCKLFQYFPQRADIALGSLSVMAERENVVDFTVPYYDLVGITILMKKPKTPTSLFKFLTVLESEVWLCILAAYFFTRWVLLVLYHHVVFKATPRRSEIITTDNV